MEQTPHLTHSVLELTLCLLYVQCTICGVCVFVNTYLFVGQFVQHSISTVYQCSHNYVNLIPCRC